MGSEGLEDREDLTGLRILLLLRLCLSSLFVGMDEASGLDDILLERALREQRVA